MIKFIIFVLIVKLISAHEKVDEASRNVQWEADDPRWDTNIPNSWDHENFVPPVAPAEEQTKEFWINQGQNVLEHKVKSKLILKKAKNLVIFIGDGMGISTQMAARVYQRDERDELSFEKFPFTGLSKTYCINYQVPDSACTATAIFSGIKNNYNVLSLSGEVDIRNCTAQRDNSTHIDNIFKYAQEDGRSTGFVTTTRITHATPAAVYAKAAFREWESNENAPEGCEDIAHQLIHGEIGSKLDVAMGGGRRHFIPNTTVVNNERGFRTDYRNLINEFNLIHRIKGTRSAVVENRDQLINIDANEVDKIFGLFAHSHNEYKMLSDGLNQPSLLDMTKKAIEIMKKNDKGYVLLVEGGRIDHAHHATQAHLALEETLQFSQAIEYVKNNTNEEDTLIVVTADHGHVFTVGGYPPRNRNIFGAGDFSRNDNMWFFTLNYANGPGHDYHFNKTGGRINPRGQRYMDPLFRYPAAVPLNSETHSGEDVGVYAVGPYAHMFGGVYEQSYIGHALMYATCLGPESFLKNPECTSSSNMQIASMALTLFAFVLKFCF